MRAPTDTKIVEEAGRWLEGVDVDIPDPTIAVPPWAGIG